MIVISKILSHPSMSAEGSRCKKDFSSSMFANVFFNNTVTIFACGPDTIFPMQIASNVSARFLNSGLQFSRRVKRFKECGHVSVVRLGFNNLLTIDIYHLIKANFFRLNAVWEKLRNRYCSKRQTERGEETTAGNILPDIKTSLAEWPPGNHY